MGNPEQKVSKVSEVTVRIPLVIHLKGKTPFDPTQLDMKRLSSLAQVAIIKVLQEEETEENDLPDWLEELLADFERVEGVSWKNGQLRGTN